MKLSEYEDVILTNVEQVPGKTIVEHYGLVTGNTVRAKHVGRDIEVIAYGTAIRYR